MDEQAQAALRELLLDHTTGEMLRQIALWHREGQDRPCQADGEASDLLEAAAQAIEDLDWAAA